MAKIIRLNIIETLTEPTLEEATDSLAFAIENERAARVRYVVVIQGITDTERYTIVLQDDHGAVAELSATFAISAEQLTATPDPTLTIEINCARIDRGIFRCVRVADLVTRSAEPLAS